MDLGISVIFTGHSLIPFTFLFFFFTSFTFRFPFRISCMDIFHKTYPTAGTEAFYPRRKKIPRRRVSFLGSQGTQEVEGRDKEIPVKEHKKVKSEELWWFWKTQNLSTTIRSSLHLSSHSLYLCFTLTVSSTPSVSFLYPPFVSQCPVSLTDLLTASPCPNTIPSPRQRILFITFHHHLYFIRIFYFFYFPRPTLFFLLFLVPVSSNLT